MRKISIFIVAAMSFAAAMAQNCPHDSIGGGGSGVGDIDTVSLSSFPAMCEECGGQWWGGWNLPDSFNGDIYLFAPTGADTFSVQVATGCRWLLMDTCILVPQDQSLGLAVLRFAVNGNVQVYVNGNAGDSVVLVCKSTPSPQEELTDILLDLQTCGIPLGIPAPVDEKYWWMDLRTGRVTDEIRGPGAWKRGHRR